MEDVSQVLSATDQPSLHPVSISSFLNSSLESEVEETSNRNLTSVLSCCIALLFLVIIWVFAKCTEIRRLRTQREQFPIRSSSLGIHGGWIRIHTLKTTMELPPPYEEPPSYSEAVDREREEDKGEGEGEALTV